MIFVLDWVDGHSIRPNRMSDVGEKEFNIFMKQKKIVLLRQRLYYQEKLRSKYLSFEISVF